MSIPAEFELPEDIRGFFRDGRFYPRNISGV